MVKPKEEILNDCIHIITARKSDTWIKYLEYYYLEKEKNVDLHKNSKLKKKSMLK